VPAPKNRSRAERLLSVRLQGDPVMSAAHEKRLRQAEQAELARAHVDQIERQIINCVMEGLDSEYFETYRLRKLGRELEAARAVAVATR
jgi:hypothetical protein